MTFFQKTNDGCVRTSPMAILLWQFVLVNRTCHLIRDLSQLSCWQHWWFISFSKCNALEDFSISFPEIVISAGCLGGIRQSSILFHSWWRGICEWNPLFYPFVNFFQPRSRTKQKHSCINWALSQLQTFGSGQSSILSEHKTKDCAGLRPYATPTFALLSVLWSLPSFTTISLYWLWFFENDFRFPLNSHIGS